MRICLSNSGDLDQAAHVHALIIIPGRSQSNIVFELSVHFIRPHFSPVQNHISVPIGQFYDIMVYNYGFIFNCTTVGQASDSMTALT